MKRVRKAIKNTNTIHTPFFVANQIGSTFSAVEKNREVSLDAYPIHSTSHSQRNKAVLGMQHTLGNNTVQRLLSSTTNDPEAYEAITNQSEEEPLSQELASHIQSRNGLGSPLDDAVQNEMEKLFDISLSGVRIHTDQEANILNNNLNAKAFTLGSDIFFRGNSGPGDKALLAHELTHVVQQSTMNTSGPLRVGPVGDHYEKQADNVADQVSAGVKKIGVLEGGGIIGGHSESPMTTSIGNGGNIQRDWLGDLGNIAGVEGLGNDIISSVLTLGPKAGDFSTGFGAGAGVLGLGTGLMGLLGEDKSPGERILGGMSTAGGLSSLAGTASTLWGAGAGGALSVGGAGGLSATMGAATSAGGAGLLSMGAGALATSAGALLGAGAAGYGAGSLIAEHTQIDEALGDGMFDVLGPGPGLWLADTFGL